MACLYTSAYAWRSALAPFQVSILRTCRSSSSSSSLLAGRVWVGASIPRLALDEIVGSSSHTAQHCGSSLISVKSKLGLLNIPDAEGTSNWAKETDGDDATISAVAIVATTTFESTRFIFNLSQLSIPFSSSRHRVFTLFYDSQMVAPDVVLGILQLSSIRNSLESHCPEEKCSWEAFMLWMYEPFFVVLLVGNCLRVRDT